MIGRLTGKLISKQPPLLVIDVQGVGYDVYAPMSSFYQLPGLEQTTTLLTHLIVREDAHTLYGFHSEQERRLFRALIKVNGVGAKLALTILSGIETDQFIQHIQNNQASLLTQIPGIGKKTAERLVVEMRDQLAKWEQNSPTLSTATDQQPIQDAISALIALGYKANEAQKSVQNAYTSDMNSETLIRAALQRIAQGVSA